MAKIKGFYKGFKFITQIFAVVKEREMEIGYPTDVKHVAHIGWDGPSGSAPSWMNEYKTAPEFSTTKALTDPMDPGSVSLISPWSSQDFDQSMGSRPVNNVFNDTLPSDLPNIPKKSKRKKKTATSSPKSSSSSFSRITAKSKAMYHDMGPTQKAHC